MQATHVVRRDVVITADRHHPSGITRCGAYSRQSATMFSNKPDATPVMLRRSMVASVRSRNSSSVIGEQSARSPRAPAENSGRGRDRSPPDRGPETLHRQVEGQRRRPLVPRAHGVDVDVDDRLGYG